MIYRHTNTCRFCNDIGLHGEGLWQHGDFGMTYGEMEVLDWYTTTWRFWNGLWQQGDFGKVYDHVEMLTLKLLTFQLNSQSSGSLSLSPIQMRP